MKIQARITIPYAVANYAEMRDRGFYYVEIGRASCRERVYALV